MHVKLSCLNHCRRWLAAVPQLRVHACIPALPHGISRLRPAELDLQLLASSLLRDRTGEAGTPNPAFCFCCDLWAGMIPF